MYWEGGKPVSAISPVMKGLTGAGTSEGPGDGNAEGRGDGNEDVQWAPFRTMAYPSQPTITKSATATTIFLRREGLTVQSYESLAPDLTTVPTARRLRLGVIGVKSVEGREVDSAVRNGCRC